LITVSAAARNVSRLDDRCAPHASADPLDHHPQIDMNENFVPVQPPVGAVNFGKVGTFSVSAI
jgi:hypothetical protein